MKKLLFFVSLLTLTTGVTSAAHAKDDLDVVKSFYSVILTTPSDLTQEQAFEILHEDYVGVPTPPAGQGAIGVFNSAKGFGQAIPDLKWEPQEILPHGNNRYTVRSLASGTASGPFLGVENAAGKKFEIMSIDIVTVVDGKISQIYHLEDWGSAIKQLSASPEGEKNR